MTDGIIFQVWLSFIDMILLLTVVKITEFIYVFVLLKVIYINLKLGMILTALLGVPRTFVLVLFSILNLFMSYFQY